MKLHKENYNMQLILFALFPYSQHFVETSNLRFRHDFAGFVTIFVGVQRYLVQSHV